MTFHFNPEYEFILRTPQISTHGAYKINSLFYNAHILEHFMRYGMRLKTYANWCYEQLVDIIKLTGIQWN